MREMYGTLPGLLVEEVELDTARKLWIVTMGYWQVLPEKPDPALAHSALAQYLASSGTAKRAYKEIKITAEDGQVQSMKVKMILGAP